MRRPIDAWRCLQPVPLGFDGGGTLTCTNTCSFDTTDCTSNTCGVSNAASGTDLPSQTAGDCRTAECNGSGGTTKPAVAGGEAAAPAAAPAVPATADGDVLRLAGTFTLQARLGGAAMLPAMPPQLQPPHSAEPTAIPTPNEISEAPNT